MGPGGFGGVVEALDELGTKRLVDAEGDADEPRARGAQRPGPLVGAVAEALDGGLDASAQCMPDGMESTICKFLALCLMRAL